jgi:RimJ/RimL family protein N-acetyltransferase
MEEIRSLFPLQGSRISLKLFQENDITEDYLSWLNDPEVVKFSNQRFKQHSKESCLNYLHSFANANALFLSIQNQQCPLGTMSVYFNPHHQTADIGIMVGNKNCWGQGIGYEAWLLLLTTLIETVSVRKVTGGTLSCNKSMVRIMEKCGMQPDGIRCAHEMVGGKVYDIIHFAAFREALIG